MYRSRDPAPPPTTAAPARSHDQPAPGRAVPRPEPRSCHPFHQSWTWARSARVAAAHTKGQPAVGSDRLEVTDTTGLAVAVLPHLTRVLPPALEPPVRATHRQPPSGRRGPSPRTVPRRAQQRLMSGLNGRGSVEMSYRHDRSQRSRMAALPRHTGRARPGSVLRSGSVTGGGGPSGRRGGGQCLRRGRPRSE